MRGHERAEKKVKIVRKLLAEIVSDFFPDFSKAKREFSYF